MLPMYGRETTGRGLGKHLQFAAMSVYLGNLPVKSKVDFREGPEAPAQLCADARVLAAARGLPL